MKKNINRLTQATYASNSEQWNGDLLAMNDRNFSCTYAYDLNSNMTALQRYGVDMYNTSLPTHIRNHGMIDNLTMTYDGNRLKKVTDQCEELSYAGAMDFKDGADKDEEYTYDANGNMTSDRNKGISSIAYNMLNLPQTVLFEDGHETCYTYAADGRKLHVEYRLNNFSIVEAEKAKASDGYDAIACPSALDENGIIETPVESISRTLMTRDYCGNYIYKNGCLERVMIENGYMQDGGLYFYIKDYQGNVRVVLNQANQPVEVNSYYPYGGLMAATTTEGTQPYKYSTKELDRENGLDLYDSKARMYDPTIGRTPTLDPMAEKYYSMSPYLWCAGNPIKYVDPTGMFFNSADSVQASIYKERLCNRKMELVNSDVDDAPEQMKEIEQSLQDIEDMRQDSRQRYSFLSIEGTPETKQLSDGTILMCIDANMSGNYAHEIRHGGQIARNEFCFVEGTPNYRYGASHEISAYRAQLASCGQVSYMPKYDFSIQTDVVLKITLFGQSSVWRTVTKLKDISVRLLKNMYEGPGIIISPIYKGKQRKEWFKR